jgi:hypothetical protein
LERFCHNSWVGRKGENDKAKRPEFEKEKAMLSDLNTENERVAICTWIFFTEANV